MHISILFNNIEDCIGIVFVYPQFFFLLYGKNVLYVLEKKKNLIYYIYRLQQLQSSTSDFCGKLWDRVMA